MHGRSNNISQSGEASTFTWAARMHFTRSVDGKVLIDKYTIITVSSNYCVLMTTVVQLINCTRRIRIHQPFHRFLFNSDQLNYVEKMGS
jgi:hypothetical protein